MNISKNTFIIGASIVAVVSGVAGFYLLSKDKPETLGWMSSSWLYRKSISVANSGDELTNEDVLVTIDTEALIDASKLQPDCDDLRFTDSDESTALDYWVEGGCDSTTTRVWVQIPTLPNGGKTIYVYYGNASATNAEEIWTSNFITLSTSSCSGTWQRNTDFDNLFPRGATAYGEASGGNTTHGHTVSASTGTKSRSMITAEQGSSVSVTNNAHSHSASASSTSSSSQIYSYLDMIFCENNDLVLTTSTVLPFDVASQTGWTQFTALNDKFPRGEATYGGTGGAATHSHTFSFSVSGAGSGSNAGCASGCVAQPTAGHTHSASNKSVSGSNMPKSLYVVYFQKDSAGTLSTEQPIIMMDAATAPLGWELFSALNNSNRFPYGSTTYGTEEAGTHSHSSSFTTGNASSTRNTFAGSAVLDMPNHTHSLSYSSNSVEVIPPYWDVVFAKRKASQSVTLGSEEVGNTAPNAPSTPYCEEASNPAQVVDTTPEFSAVFSDTDSSDTGNYYEIEVNTASNFTGTVMWDTGKTAFGTPIVNGERSSDISYNGTALSSGTTYYWRIKFWDNQAMNSESDWSSVQNFIMNAAPTATAPYCEGTTNPTKVTDSTPEFSAVFNDANSSDTGTYYEIEVMSIIHCFDFPGAMLWDTDKTSISSPLSDGARSIDYSYAGNALSDGGTYCWRMRFWDNNDLQGTWTTTSTFTMSGPPSKPSALKTDGKTNPTIILTSNPTFSAKYSDPNSDNSLAYEIEVNSASDFEGTIMWDTGKVLKTITSGTTGNIANYAGTALTNSSNVYYWRIRFWDTEDTVGVWSDTAQFTDFYQSFRMEGIGLDGLKIN